MAENGRAQISKSIEGSPGIEINVFAQESGIDNAPSIAFSPRADSIWPHQSIVVLADIYRVAGLYDLKYKISADQIYLAIARQTHSWKIHAFPLNYYDLSGVSANFSLDTPKNSGAKSPKLC
ncbi:MAG: hypothetical protein JKY41_11565 [Rhodobacteraceae bacterium]|nr:hypothetical protein [Paracoccaceae bacterium]